MGVINDDVVLRMVLIYNRNTDSIQEKLLYDIFHTASSVYDPKESYLTLVFEYVNQDLSQFIERYPPPGVPEDLIKSMMHQLLNAVDFLHTNRMVHRDLKPQNILVTKDGQIKVADFGLARIYGFCMALTSVVVTLWYRAPEVLLQTTYATAVDIWSVGCILAEMYNRRPLFPGRSDVDQLHRIFSIIGTPLEEEWPQNVSLPWTTFRNYSPMELHQVVPEMIPEGLPLLKKMLEFKPSQRISAKDALSHPYFRDLDLPDSQDSGIELSAHEGPLEPEAENKMKTVRPKLAEDTSERMNMADSGVGQPLKRRRTTESEESCISR